MATYTIIRDDGIDDGIAGRSFASFDEAYIVVESYYADTCCSDESATYRIVEAAASNAMPSQVEKP
jgi:hypothetical protein